jgi:transcriptional regulator of acetoin/glycerol metabolism
MRAPLNDLTGVPLDQLLVKAMDRLRGATLDELSALLKPSSSVIATDDALARAILALPGKGSKLGAAERAVVLHALNQCGGNVSATARLLGIDRKALERKIRRIKRTSAK